MRRYKNGAMLGSATPANSAVNGPSNLYIGGAGLFGNADPLNDWIDELRITKLASTRCQKGV
ncbi:hypothetical protein [Bradyrhizobium shewense]|uniref:hypothetical protein n=1 Tax=Bradyrhizobium shewense TaxID=1761772 RepID=UPI001FDAC1C0|nr:hypothetical protein [Bradyrhizobium shewense]